MHVTTQRSLVFVPQDAHADVIEASVSLLSIGRVHEWVLDHHGIAEVFIERGA